MPLDRQILPLLLHIRLFHHFRQPEPLSIVPTYTVSSRQEPRGRTTKALESGGDSGPLRQILPTTIFYLSFWPHISIFLQIISKMTNYCYLNSSKEGPQFSSFRVYVPSPSCNSVYFQYCWLPCGRPWHLDDLDFSALHYAVIFCTFWLPPNLGSWNTVS